MTAMLLAQRDAAIARLHFQPPMSAPQTAAPETAAPDEIAAAHIGLIDAHRPGVRAGLFLAARPWLYGLAQRIFGFSVENRLADTRLEAIRRFALGESLAGRAESPHSLVSRWKAAF